MRARYLGDADPGPVSAELVPHAEARRRMDQPDGSGDWSDGKPPPDAQVWFVRARGSFVVPHPPLRLDEETGKAIPQRPTAGWMFTVLNPDTGHTIISGFRGGEPPG